jgi:nitroimidazol reductase NimA-like FMN-containing flavoprotein (pyridoxamine 5'-phosphate oxidase superfamily)
MTDALERLQQQTFADASSATIGSYPEERRLRDGQLAAYLDRCRYAVVGTTRSDGRPHAALSSYRRQESSFWLPTVAGSARARNVRGGGWATLTVYQGDGVGHVAVIVEGPAAVVARNEAPEEVAGSIASDWVAEWIRIDAERILSYAAEDADL